MSDRVPLYDEFSESYDVMVSWQERLDREEPFFRELFHRNNARRVLDVGCATGRHVLRFVQLGLEATGADPSAAMIGLAQEEAAGRAGVRFIRAGFGQLQSRIAGKFDAVTCLGNTLPHAAAPGALDEAVQDMAAVMTPGGVLAIQQLNYDRILKERHRFLGASSGTRNGTEHLFFRFYDFDGDGLTFNVVTFRKPDGGGWDFQVASTHLRAITRDELTDALVRAGFGSIRCLGSYSGEPFDANSSGDLVVTASRTA